MMFATYEENSIKISGKIANGSGIGSWLFYLIEEYWQWKGVLNRTIMMCVNWWSGSGVCAGRRHSKRRLGREEGQLVRWSNNSCIVYQSDSRQRGNSLQTCRSSFGIQSPTFDFYASWYDPWWENIITIKILIHSKFLLQTLMKWLIRR